MKTLLFFFIFVFSAMTVSAQWDPEIETSHFGRFQALSDRTGWGHYEYANAGLNFRDGEQFFGGTIEFANSDVHCQSGERLTAKDIVFSLNYFAWGDWGSRSFTVAIFPGIRSYSNHWVPPDGEEIWEEGYCAYSRGFVYLTDSLDRWFRSWKFFGEFQENRWKGQDEYPWYGRGNVTANKSYHTLRTEVSARRLPLKRDIRLEPRLIAGYLYNADTEVICPEAGLGLAISVVKNRRYYEALCLQYRQSYDYGSDQMVGIFEATADFVGIYQLFKK